MEIQINKPAFNKNREEEAIFRELSAEVSAYLKQAGKKPKRRLILKFAVYTLLLAGAYYGILTTHYFILSTLYYILLGFVLVLLGLNFAHDFAHNSIFKSKKLNNTCFELLFGLMGINGYLWKKRHTHSHHNYPNTEGYDVDIELGRIIHLSEGLPGKAHKYQHLYAPVLYLIYTLYWVFYKDVVLMCRKNHANLHFKKHKTKEWVKFFAFKILYISYILIIPIVFGRVGAGYVLAGFIVMHLLSALFLLLTFLITHHVENTHYYHADEGILNSSSWFMHQLGSSNDFHPFSRWANYIFGGFNCHAAHHLYPGVCHVYYPSISRMIYARLNQCNVPVNTTSWWGGVASHFRLLKATGTGVLP